MPAKESTNLGSPVLAHLRMSVSRSLLSNAVTLIAIWSGTNPPCKERLCITRPLTPYLGSLAICACACCCILVGIAFTMHCKVKAMCAQGTMAFWGGASLAG